MRINKYLLIISFLIFYISVVGQTVNLPKKNWQNLDFEKDGLFGISTEKAYLDLIKDKPCKEVIVAVIDGGVDINHEDLSGSIWVNPKEIPGNKKDDDRNGFIDDIHGWNFYNDTRHPDESEISLLVTEMNAIKASFDNKEFDRTKRSLKDLPRYQELLKMLDNKLSPYRDKLKIAIEDKMYFDNILKNIGKDNPSIGDFKNYVPRNANELNMLKNIISGLKIVPDYIVYKRLNLDRAIYLYNMELTFYEHQDYDITSGGPTAYHGTHIAGIIAAGRDNDIGINGIAKNVKIMVLRAINGVEPIREGSEPGLKMGLKSDVENEQNEANEAKAKAIRYAVDNGAKVINMSFGQSWAKISPEYDQAIKYAISRDVLIVHASGNESLNLDSLITYPNRNTDEGKNILSQWIEVAASGYEKNDKVATSFSNYGNNSVDIYAPGVEIISSVPRSQYMADTGTSMAAPVVAGMAALIWGYYPKLNAKQVKEIIVNSVTKINFLKCRCVSGGVANVYRAFVLAEKY